MKRDIQVYFDDIIESIVLIAGYTKDVSGKQSSAIFPDSKKK